MLATPHFHPTPLLRSRVDQRMIVHHPLLVQEEIVIVSTHQHSAIELDVFRKAVGEQLLAFRSIQIVMTSGRVSLASCACRGVTDLSRVPNGENHMFVPRKL